MDEEDDITELKKKQFYAFTPNIYFLTTGDWAELGWAGKWAVEWV